MSLGIAIIHYWAALLKPASTFSCQSKRPLDSMVGMTKSVNIQLLGWRRCVPASNTMFRTTKLSILSCKVVDLSSRLFLLPSAYAFLRSDGSEVGTVHFFAVTFRFRIIFRVFARHHNDVCWKVSLGCRAAWHSCPPLPLLSICTKRLSMGQ